MEIFMIIFIESALWEFGNEDESPFDIFKIKKRSGMDWR